MHTQFLDVEHYLVWFMIHYRRSEVAAPIYLYSDSGKGLKRCKYVIQFAHLVLQNNTFISMSELSLLYNIVT